MNLGLGMLHSFLNPDEGYRKAQGEYGKGWDKAQEYGKPYWEAGNNQRDRLTGAEDQLLDPEALQAKWAGGYEASPYAKNMIQESKNSGMDAASSMGLLGSSSAINNIQQSAGNIMQQDRQQYMNDLMQKYMHGVGIGQNIYNQGSSMGQHLGNQAMDYGDKMAEAKFGETNSPGQNYGDMLRFAIQSALAANGTPSAAKGG